MPFQSEKQRKYLHANHPEIAKRWERDYSNGGIAELNQQLNSLPEYYLPYPAAQGGRIGFDSGSNGITLGSDRYNITLEPGASGSWTETDLGEGYNIKDKNISYGVDTTTKLGPVKIGIDFKNFLDKYDLTEDGTTVDKDTQKDEQIAYMLGVDVDTLYAKIESDKKFENWYLTIRKTFRGGGTPAHEAGIYGLAEGGQLVQPGPGRPGYNGQGDYTPDRSTPSTGGGPPGGGDPGMTYTAPTVSTTAASEDAYGTPETTTTSTTDDKGDRIIDIAERKRREDLRNIVAQGEKTEKWEKAQQWNKPNIFQRGLNYITEHPIESLLNVLSFGGVGAAKTALRINSAINFGKKVVSEDIQTALKNGFTDAANQMKTHNSKLDVYESLPDGHPEKIALQAELKIGKKTTPDGPDGPNGVTQDTSITIDAEEVNDAKTQLLRKYQEMNEASRLAWLRQQQMNRDKQEAYYKMFRDTYMSAQGGRVPGGYNTGGLSNLFRLKNV